MKRWSRRRGANLVLHHPLFRGGLKSGCRHLVAQSGDLKGKGILFVNGSLRPISRRATSLLKCLKVRHSSKVPAEGDQSTSDECNLRHKFEILLRNLIVLLISSKNRFIGAQ